MMATKTYKSIAGSNAGGITVLDSSNGLTTLENYTPGAGWQTAASAPDGAAPGGICGSVAGGVATHFGADVSYLTVLNSQLATWKTLPKPGLASVKGIAGDPSNCLTVYGEGADGEGKGDKVWQIRLKDLKDEEPTWQPKAAPAFKVSAVGGDVANGALVLVVDERGSKLYKNGSDNQWVQVLAIPFKVDCMCGDYASGMVFYGEGQLRSATDLSKGTNKLAAPPFRIVAMTGNAKEGVAAIAGAGDFIVYCGDLAKGVWSVVLGPMVV